MASLSWTDAGGSATLTNVLPAALSRFSAFTTLPDNKQDEDEAMTGVGYAFRFAELFDAALRLDNIANSDGALVARFVRHCRNFGVFSVATNDLAARTYPTCQAVVGSPPSYAYQDTVTLEWSLVIPRFRNVAPVGAEMIALYG